MKMKIDEDEIEILNRGRRVWKDLECLKIQVV